MKRIALCLSLLLNSLCIYGVNFEQIFTKIFVTNFWGSHESFSGEGSTMFQTRIIRQEIPQLLRELDIKLFLDAPCGRFWKKMRLLHIF